MDHPEEPEETNQEEVSENAEQGTVNVPTTDRAPVASGSNLAGPSNLRERAIPPVRPSPVSSPVSRHSNPYLIVNAINAIFKYHNKRIMVVSDNKFDSWFATQFVPAESNAPAKVLIHTPFQNFCPIGGLKCRTEEAINEFYKTDFNTNLPMNHVQYVRHIITQINENEFIFTLAAALCIAMEHDLLAFKALLYGPENSRRLWKVVIRIINSGTLPLGSAQDVWKYP